MESGYFKYIDRVVHHEASAGVPEQYHLEVIKEYANGGKDVKKVIDVAGVPAKEAWDEVVHDKVWIEYTAKEIKQMRIEELKKLLAESD